MEKTKIYLNYLSTEERESMTKVLSFLVTNDKESKGNLIHMAAELYAKEKTIELLTDNGHAPNACRSHTWGEDKHFWSIVDFQSQSLSPQALELMGKEYESDRKWGFRYYYAISVCKEDRELYLTSFQNTCSPNWNGEYEVRWYDKLQDVGFPILQDSCTIYRMDDALHGAINDRLWAKRKKFVVTKDSVRMTIKDQHGNYCDLLGYTAENVFRMYADKYTGYRNYRRQMASEWEIVDEEARQRYDEWRQTATGLKSDFDKFYGSGIVD